MGVVLELDFDGLSGIWKGKGVVGKGLESLLVSQRRWRGLVGRKASGTIICML